MAYNHFHNPGQLDHPSSRPRLYAPLPPVPSDSSPKTLSPYATTTVLVSPISSSLDGENADHNTPAGGNSNRGYFDYHRRNDRMSQNDPFDDKAAIQMQTHYIKDEPRNYPYTNRDLESSKKPKKRWFAKPTPWFIYVMTFIQISVFVAEIVKNAILTGSPIETAPEFNPMIGPSTYVLINMGARYVPCMRNEAGIQNASVTLHWPCPWTTDDSAKCTLSEVCGFSGVPNPHPNGSLDEEPAPNQWFRFIVPIFLHAGLVHIGFNMLLQLLRGSDMERAIGPVRVALVYFSSGIFGFVLGGNFAASGIASTGASGSLFGIIALTLLDLLYTWTERKHPGRTLLFILLDIIISFVLGLLPGLDNFSHIGGFLMGLVLGVCLLRSPTQLRQRIGSAPISYKNHAPQGSQSSLVPHQGKESSQKGQKSFYSRPSSAQAFTSPRTFFSGRKPLWWAWWLLRVAALVGVIAAFGVLVTAFYSHHATECSWCKYLSCLPVNNWCDIGNLNIENQSPSRLL